MDDRELIRRLIAGEADAWRMLVEGSAGLMRAMVLRVLPADGAGEAEVEDVLQSVFLKLWAGDRRRLREFRGRCRLSTWLAAVARREALDRRRKGERHARLTRAAHGDAVRSLLDDVQRASDPADDGRVLDAHRRRQVAHAVADLPARDRLLIRLVYEDGCAYREAARVLGARENSIGPWLSRAQARLRAALAPERRGERTDGARTDL